MTDFEAHALPLLLGHISDRRSRSDVVVLERLARSAGNTSLYNLETPGDLEALARLLQPSSRVHVYLDGQIRSASWSPETRADIEQALQVSPEHQIVFATRAKTGRPSLEHYYIYGSSELDEASADLREGETVWFGDAWGPIDGEGVVMFDLPDEDGVFRPAPH